MLKRLIAWVKVNKLAAFLLVVFLFYILRNVVGTFLGFGTLGGLQIGRKIQPSYQTYPQYGAPSAGTGDAINLAPPSGSGFETGSGAFGVIGSPGFSMEQKSEAGASSTERIVIQNSNLSLLVKDVRETGDLVLQYAKTQGGFMVSTSYSRPTESPFATITVRVPSEKFDEALKYFRSLGIKVTNENLVGTDVTEEYTDIEARIATLEKTKQKFETILDRAEEVQDILKVQREIINMQTQIDSLKGQKKSIEENAAFTKMTLFLSTDELALPYTPDKTFRPAVIFKLAVRSLLNTLRVIGTMLIWLAVYSVVWVPVLGLYLYIRKRRKAQTPVQS